MSWRCGAANQSRERNRFTGLRSVIGELLSEAGDGAFEAEQAAGQRLLRTLFVAESLPCRGGIDRLEVGACEAELGDIGTGKAHGGNQFALRRVAPRRPAREQAEPQETLAVD